MLASSIPSKYNIPFANSAGVSYTRNIPEASQIGITPGAASLTDGFPPLNFLPVSSGGVPPFGQDFNGLLNHITKVQQWQNAGGIFKYDSAFSTAIGGYPQGAILQSTDNMSTYLSLIDNNTDNPNSGTSANWSLVHSATIGKQQKFTANGSFTVPAGVATIYISACAAGGGGGGSKTAGASQSSGGGASGGYGEFIIKQTYTVTPGQVISITIGGGGVAGAVGGNGGDGGNTIIGTLITLTGGGGGGAGGAPSGVNSVGGAPSAIGYPSGSYGEDANSNFDSGFGAPGSSGPFGGGSRLTKGSAGNAVASLTASGYGSGGGGAGGVAGNASGNGAVGGAGGSGLVIIEW